MKKISYSLLIIFSLFLGVRIAHAAATSTLVVDYYCDWDNGVDAASTTAGTLASSCHGVDTFTWTSAATATYYTASSTGLINMPVPVRATSNGTFYGTPSTKTIAFDMNVPSQDTHVVLGSTKNEGVVSGFIYSGIPKPCCGNNQNWDLVQMDGSGQGGVLQENASTTGSVTGLAMYAHTSNHLASNGGKPIAVVQNKYYWYTMRWSLSRLAFDLSIYDPANNYALVGTSTSPLISDATNLGWWTEMKYLNDHSLQVGVSNFYDNMMIDYTNVTYPLVPDAVAPQVGWIAPANNATVSGSSVPLNATSSDNSNLLGVQFFVDNTPIGAQVAATTTAQNLSTSTNPSFTATATWDSTSVSSGTHTLYAVAEDTSGNYATTSETVTVSNATSFLYSLFGLSNGLVGYWTFDGKDVVNGVAMDRSGNGNNGNLINIATSTFYTLGKIGQAFNFDGVNDYIKVNTTGIDLSSTGATYSLWFKPTSLNNAEGALLANSSGSTNKFGITLSGNTVAGAYNNGSIFAKSGTISNTGWHQAVFIWNGASQFLYIDGVVQSGSTAPSISNSTGVVMGMSTDLSSTPFNGSIDDVRIYSRALSPGEVSQLYNSGSTKYAASPQVISGTGLSNGLVGYWTFDGKDTTWTSSTAGTAKDLSGNGNTGTFNKMNVATSTGLGKIGQAINLNGTSAYVYNGSPTGLPSGAAPRTYSAWFKLSSIPATDNTIFDIVGNGGNDAGAEGYSAIAISRGTNGQTGVQQIFWDTRSSGRLWSWTPDTKWHHLVGVYPPGGGTNSTLIMYLDGSLLSAGATCVGGCGTLNNAVGALTIGAVPRTCCAESQFFPGLIDDVRIYNRALSANEVSQLYNLGSTKYDISPKVIPGIGLSNGLIGYWTFDGKDVVNGVAMDKSGNGNNGNLINIATSTFYALGKIGQAFNFDGVSDNAVSLSTLSSVTKNGSFSFSLWFKSKTGNIPAAINILEHALNTSDIFAIGAAAANVITVGVYNGTTYTKASTAFSQDTKWHHIVATYNGSTITGYYDNVLMAGSSQPNTAVTTGFKIGKDVNSSTRDFSGSIDDVRIYNRVLSVGEISRLYHTGAK